MHTKQDLPWSFHHQQHFSVVYQYLFRQIWVLEPQIHYRTQLADYNIATCDTLWTFTVIVLHTYYYKIMATVVDHIYTNV